MNLIRINSPDDPRVAAYREIREQDLVGRQNLFVAEGKVVLNVALSATAYGLQSVLLLENRLAGLQAILANAPASLPVYVADAAVMDAIAGFHIHRGILAIGKRLRTTGTLRAAEQSTTTSARSRARRHIQSRQYWIDLSKCSRLRRRCGFP